MIRAAALSFESTVPKGTRSFNLTGAAAGRILGPLRTAGKADTVARHLELDISVLRVGDVGIVGIPGEPFSGIGREMKAASPLPLTIPCGYTNPSHGYITDSANTGDREYMSSFYRYTRFRPPFKKPAGSVLATQAVRALKRLAK